MEKLRTKQRGNAANNLLRETWTKLDARELRLLLDLRIGGGQYDNRDVNPNKFYLPLAGSQCRVALTFRGKKIVAIEQGELFDAAEWRRFSDEIENGVLVGPRKVGRGHSFSSFRVLGSWRGAQSGVQILPPAADAPVAPFEMAEHPFILEFPIIGASDELWPITNYRRMREHRRLVRLLDVSLTARVRNQPTGPDIFGRMSRPPRAVRGTAERNGFRNIFRLLWVRRSQTISRR